MPYKVDFKQLATEIDIADVADLLKLKVIKGRAHCPVCDSERAIQLYPETNSFCCHSADISGDCISYMPTSTAPACTKPRSFCRNSSRPLRRLE